MGAPFLESPERFARFVAEWRAGALPRFEWTHAAHVARFWSMAIGALVERRRFTSAFDAACAAVRQFGDDRSLYRRYYDFDIVADGRARREWIPPQRDVSEPGTT